MIVTHGLFVFKFSQRHIKTEVFIVYYKQSNLLLEILAGGSSFRTSRKMPQGIYGINTKLRGETLGSAATQLGVWPCQVTNPPQGLLVCKTKATDRQSVKPLLTLIFFDLNSVNKILKHEDDTQFGIFTFLRILFPVDFLQEKF